MQTKRMRLRDSSSQLLLAVVIMLSMVPFVGYSQGNVVPQAPSLGPPERLYDVPGLGRFLLPDGDDVIQNYLKRGEIWEKAEQDQFERYVQPTFVVIDAGAYVGSHTVKLAKLAYHGTVYAFEPQKLIYEILQKTIQLNNLTNVKAFPYALGERACLTHFASVNPKNYGAARVTGCDNVPSTDAVETRTIDSFDIQRVDFMKIDVEGSELRVLEGALKTIARHKPVLVIEIDSADRTLTLEKLGLLDYEWEEYRPRNFVARPKTD